MDFRQLKYFTVVAQELNITRAAGKIGMSQPPLSNQIKLLEQDLGVQLFIRGKRGLELTEAGRLLYRRSDEMLELADKTRSEMASFGAELSGRVSIATVDGLGPFLAARWIRGFREEFPLVEYSVWNGSSDDVIDRLSRGLADIGIIIAPYDTEHLAGISVWRESWVAILSEKHPLAAVPGDTVPLASVAEYPLIAPQRASRVESLERWFAGIGKEPRILCRLSNYMDAAALALEDVGIAIFPETGDRPWPGTIAKVITDPPRSAEYELVCFRDKKPMGAAGRFIDYVTKWKAGIELPPEKGAML